MRNTYQSKGKKSRKFELVGGRELAVHLPLPLVEVWEELQARVEQLAGEAGLKILQGSDHIARWTAAGMLEAEKKFRKVKGYRELKELAAKLSRDFGMHSTPQQQVA